MSWLFKYLLPTYTIVNKYLVVSAFKLLWISENLLC